LVKGELRSLSPAGSGRTLDFSFRGDPNVRVMMIIKTSAESEAGLMPTEERFAAMGALMDEMSGAGVLLAVEGLQASSKGVRIHASGKIRTVTDGPFAETKEMIGGFAIIKVNSMDEAIGWAHRYLDVVGSTSTDEVNVEMRPLFEMEDFGDEFTPELRQAEERLRAEIGQKQ